MVKNTEKPKNEERAVSFYDYDSAIFRDNEPGGDWPSPNLSQWYAPTIDCDGCWIKYTGVNGLSFRGWSPELVYLIMKIKEQYRRIGRELSDEQVREKLFEPEK